MAKYYIASTGANSHSTTNIREKPSTTNSNVVGSLTSIGSTALLIKDRIYGGFVWSNYLFPSGLEGWIRSDVHKRAYLTSGINIEVPYVSQEDRNSDEHVNDCGIAEAKGFVDKYHDNTETVEQMARYVGMTRYGLTTFDHIFRTLNRYGVKHIYARPFNLVSLINSLNVGKAAICLINYKYMFPNRPIPHFVTAKGYENESILLNDPLNVENKSQPFFNFASAIARTDENGNMPFQAIVEL